jgi:recombinational DNA repair ATPase RecF
MTEQGCGVAEIVSAKLADDKVPDQVASLIRAAMRGGRDSSVDQHGEEAQVGAPGRVYLKSIGVQGFRGIADAVTLHLQAGPGLTVVTGRNGSGKSSFAEAAEIALTGDNMRWSERTAVWKEGWRNLHQPDPAAIEVKLAEDGQPAPTVVTRQWAPGAGLGDAQAFISVAGKREPLDARGWAGALELYRPFLSYSELGALVGGKPSSMHDALQAILGLDVLIDAERVLGESRRAAEATAKLAQQQLPALLATLASHPDARARAAEQILGGKTWDLQALMALAVNDEAAADGRLAQLQEIVAITLPTLEDASAAAVRLDSARAAVDALAGTAASEARQLADLLSAALEHQRSHADEPCPVCGGRVLDDAWAASATESIADLTARARDADAAHDELTAARLALRELAPHRGVPRALSAELGGDADFGGGDPVAAREAWAAFVALADAATSADAGTSADTATPAHAGAPVGSSAIINTFRVLSDEVAAVRSAAGRVLRERAEAWQPVAADLAAWGKVAEDSQAAAVRNTDFRKALDLLRQIGREVRNDRLAPFAKTSAQVWETLRQESNVELGPITLAGAGPQRKVALDVTIDGVPGAALSVMSQGELHALGLALFLPRATAADSPFGFVVIDDPVQAMDPAKVDGLARVLSLVARSRQVVVFTHDDRLPAALRQLQLPATVLAVTRRERSVVSVRKVGDPVSRYLDDARAIAKTDALPATARAVAVAGLCRGAMEAACVEAVRSRDLSAGVAHSVVEGRLDDASHSLQDMVALALFGNTSQAGEVPGRLRVLAGQGSVNAFWAAKKGVHDPHNGDLKLLIDDTERLAKALRR